MGPIKPIQNYSLAITHSIHSFSFFHADQQNKSNCNLPHESLTPVTWFENVTLPLVSQALCLVKAFYDKVLWSRYFYPYSPLKRSLCASAALSGSCGRAAKIIFETPCTSGDLHKALQAISGQQLGRPSYY